MHLKKNDTCMIASLLKQVLLLELSSLFTIQLSAQQADTVASQIAKLHEFYYSGNRTSVTDSILTGTIDTSQISATSPVTVRFFRIDFASSIWSGVISYTSLTKTEQTSFDCAYSFIKSFDDNGITFSGMGIGTRDCFLTFITRYTLKYLRDTQAIKELARALSDAGNYDIIIAKLSEVISEDAIFEFIEVLTENGIKKGTEPIWIKE